MGFLLNCSGRDTTLRSLCEGFDCTVAELERVLLGIDLEAEFTANPYISKTANKLLFEHACSVLGEPDEVDLAYWFHGTRTAAANQFTDGILPLNHAATAVIRMLADNAPDSTVRARISSWNEGSVPDRLFRTRHGSSSHWGPYASLIREIQLENEDTGHRDYTAMPEMIEDVCKAYRKHYGTDLIQHYSAVLKPRMIWFTAPPNDGQRCIEAALAYAYTCVRSLPPDSCANWGIDRHGVAVPSEDIVQIEELS